MGDALRTYPEKAILVVNLPCEGQLVEGGEDYDDCGKVPERCSEFLVRPEGTEEG